MLGLQETSLSHHHNCHNTPIRHLVTFTTPSERVGPMFEQDDGPEEIRSFVHFYQLESQNKTE